VVLEDAARLPVPVAVAELQFPVPSPAPASQASSSEVVACSPGGDTGDERLTDRKPKK
jgi:hypothetical protein